MGTMNERDAMTAHTIKANEAKAVPTPAVIIPERMKYRCRKCNATYCGSHKCPRRKEIGLPCY
jgi:predicted metal-binding protein